MMRKVSLLSVMVCGLLQCGCVYFQSGSLEDRHDDVVKDSESTDHVLKRKKGIEHEEKQKDRMKITRRELSVYFDSPCVQLNRTVDCSGLNLDHINSSWFPNRTEIIFFNSNFLYKLENETFSHLIRLKHLDLSDNHISTFDLLAFEGLLNLKYLSLSYNKINFAKVSVNIFKPLKSLEHLGLWFQQDQRYDIPYAMLQPLTRLRNLSISTVQSSLYLGPEFLNLQNLTVLKITGSTRNITNRSFENIEGLETLVLQDLTFINFIDVDAFVHLKHLTSLILRRVFLDLKNVLPILWPFRGRSMKEIYARIVTTQISVPNPWKNGFLARKDIMYLTDICVESVTIFYCNIYYITADAIGTATTWHRCLRVIVLTENPLIGSYIALYSLSILQNIATVVVNKALRSCETFSQFPSPGLSRKYFFEEMYQNNNLYDGTLLNSEDSVVVSNRLSQEIQMLPNKTLRILNSTLYIHVSESLLSWESQNLIPEASLSIDITIQGANNLQYIDISGSGYHTFSGKLQGLSSLRTAIVSGNNLKEFSESFLDGFLGLENLAASKCQLDKDFFAMKSNRIFQNTRKLKELDISENSLNALSPGTFSTNVDLGYLSLSGNMFNDIPFDLKVTPNLKTLDLSNNAITTFTYETTHDLDMLYSKNGQMKLKLNGNILSCGCRDLHFLHWLNQTLLSLDNNRNYTCINKDGVRTNTLEFSDLESLWRECWGEVFFYIAIIILCVYIIGVVLTFLIDKNKHFLVSYFLQLLGDFKLHTRFDYKTDVYIGYSDEDYRFPCIELREYLERNLKLSTFIIDRDLLASTDKASGILDAMNSCWRILLVCSESFLKNEDWSMFTMRSAMYAQSPANPTRIVIVVHMSCLAMLPRELLSVVHDENILVLTKWTVNYTLSEKLRTRLMA
ncbi:toll-like receptor 4 isoform X1 [Biomphalaria glabrata]|uniref:Toll-like receptor 4 isoform X1 n=2 Tax=Biomphalaria glabrata TaxID=6526 RepID=A0A9W2YRK4_BIOGL|nr:toll-like receptor 4 isoform X1 [Biomphalaria glabrata]